MGGIFCVEGQWHRSLTDRSSVLPTLELLERRRAAEFIHKDVATEEELTYFLSRWVEPRYSRFQVGYLAMHGESKQVYVTDREPVEIDAIAQRLDGKCAGKRFYFGSCGVLKASDAVLVDFLQTTGAAMMCGYTRYVDWLECAAFETIVLNSLVNGKRIDSTEKTMRSNHWSPLASRLGFKIVYASGRVA